MFRHRELRERRARLCSICRWREQHYPCDGERTELHHDGILPVVLLPALRICGGSLRAQLSVDCF